MNRVLDILKKIVKAPSYPNNAERQRKVSVLSFILHSMFVAVIFGILALNILFEEKLVSGFVIYGLFAIIVILYILMKFGYEKISSKIFIFSFWLIATAAIYLASVTSSPVLGLYISISIMSGILINLKWSLAFGILSSLTILFFAILQIVGYDFPHMFYETPQARWFDFTIFIYLAIIPVYLMLKNLSAALKKSDNEIEQHKKTNEKLKNSEKKFQDIANRIPSIVFQLQISNGAALLNYINPRAYRVLGIDEKTFNQDWYIGNYVIEEDKSKFLESFNKSVSTQSDINIEYRIRDNEDKVIWLEMIAIPQIVDGELVYNGIINNNTEKKEIELDKAKKERLEALGTLSGGIAHDLNNMLSPVIGFAEILERSENLSDDEKFMLQQIEQAGERSAQLIENLLLYSREKVPEMVELEVNSVIVDSVNLICSSLGSVKLEMNLTQNQLMVEGNQSQLSRVFINLIKNSKDSIKESGKIVISSYSTEGRVFIEFSDNGCGMTDETKSKIFEPFYSTKGGGGTGLGLANVYTIIAQHHGKITVSSEIDKGTTFRLSLPAI